MRVRLSKLEKYDTLSTSLRFMGILPWTAEGRNNGSEVTKGENTTQKVIESILFLYL